MTEPADAPKGYEFGFPKRIANLVHLVKCEPWNNRALCGVRVHDTISLSSSPVCRRCRRIHEADAKLDGGDR